VAPLVARKHWMTFDWKDLNVVKSLASPLVISWGLDGQSSCCRAVSSMLATELMQRVWYGAGRLGRCFTNLNSFRLSAVFGV